jgi:ABC-type glycerol-3-phosphate transport system substrate-binding protein
MLIRRPRCWWFVALLPVIAAGCPQNERSDKAAEKLPFAGQEIRISVPAGMGLQTAWDGPLNEWAAQTGAKYILNEVPVLPGSERPSLLSNTGSETLAIFPFDLAVELIGAGELAPVPKQVLQAGDDGLDWHDLFAGLREKLAANKGRPMFVPLAAPVLVCYYRQDLLKAANLSPPQTWEEYQQLLDNLESWAPGLTASEPWSDSFRATMFLARAVSSAQHPAHYSLFFDIETGQPLIDSPAFVRALESARAAVQKMPADVLQYGPQECRREILQGRAAMVIAFESADSGIAAHSRDRSDQSIERDRDISLGFIRLPGSREVYDASRHVWESAPDKGIHRVTLTGFGGWAVGCWARQSQMQIEASWNALIQVAGPRLSSGLPVGLAGLCRDSQLAGASSFVGTEIDGIEAGAYATAVAQSLRDDRLVAELPFAVREELRDALSRAIASAFSNSATPAEALGAAAVAWRATVDRFGKDRLRDNYRISLGLSPKPGRE